MKINNKNIPSPFPSPLGGEGGVRGKRILITRAREQASGFRSRLRNLGAEVIEFPTIEIVPPRNWEGLDQAIDQLNSYDWMILTSANGVHFFWQRLGEKGRFQRLPSSLKVCAIGPATANQLKKRGVRVDYMPKKYFAEDLLKGFDKRAIQGRRLLLARARIARDVLPKGLRKLGAKVDVVEAYRTIKPRGGAKRLKQLLTNGGIDAITFTSSSTVNHFAQLLKKVDFKKLLKNIVVACIGPVTARTARGWGMNVRIQPKEYTIPGLTDAIANYFSTHRK